MLFLNFRHQEQSQRFNGSVPCTEKNTLFILGSGLLNIFKISIWYVFPYNFYILYKIFINMIFGHQACYIIKIKILKKNVKAIQQGPFSVLYTVIMFPSFNTK